ncbi:GNAT family N-acetyltransferase [Ureibacillus sp. NPDC094379]
MEIIIRRAVKDDAPMVAPLIYDAIGDIAHRLTGEVTEYKTIEQLEVLFKRTDNRHSYVNTYVVVNNQANQILGMIVLYSGKDGEALDASLQQWLKSKNAPISKIDPEAHSDEYYIDTICVHESSRGLGLGTKLLQFAEQVAIQKGFSKLSLNVEREKESARKLYERVGFDVTEPWTIINEPFDHMVKKI